MPLGRSDARGGRAGTMGGRREAPSCPAPLGAGVPHQPLFLGCLARDRKPTSIADSDSTPPRRRPGCPGAPPDSPTSRGQANNSEVSPASPFAPRDCSDGSLVANLLSLAAEFVRTGEQSVQPIAVLTKSDVQEPPELLLAAVRPFCQRCPTQRAAANHNNIPTAHFREQRWP